VINFLQKILNREAKTELSKKSEKNEMVGATASGEKLNAQPQQGGK